jgi:hypothetical protein
LVLADLTAFLVLRRASWLTLARRWSWRRALLAEEVIGIAEAILASYNGFCNVEKIVDAKTKRHFGGGDNNRGDDGFVASVGSGA